MSKSRSKRRRTRTTSSPTASSTTTVSTTSGREASSGAASRAGAAAGGVFGRILGPPVPASQSTMPNFRTSLGQGFLLVAATAVLVIGSLVLVFLAWLALLALGFVGSTVALSQMLAMPPISTAFDTQNAVSIAGQSTGLVIALGLLLVRALVVAVIAGLIVEGFERRGAVTRYGAVRGVAAYPLVLAMVMLSFVGLFIAQFGSSLGPGLGMLLQVLVPAFVLYAVGFVPFAAVRERRPLGETLRRSYAAARTPGGRHASFCLLYVLLAFVLPLFIPGRTTITANPEPWTWVGVYLVNVVHVGFTAAMGYRWLAVESTIETPTTGR